MYEGRDPSSIPPGVRRPVVIVRPGRTPEPSTAERLVTSSFRVGRSLLRRLAGYAPDAAPAQRGLSVGAVPGEVVSRERGGAEAEERRRERAARKARAKRRGHRAKRRRRNR